MWKVILFFQMKLSFNEWFVTYKYIINKFINGICDPWLDNLTNGGMEPAEPSYGAVQNRPGVTRGSQNSKNIFSELEIPIFLFAKKIIYF